MPWAEADPRRYLAAVVRGGVTPFRYRDRLRGLLALGSDGALRSSRLAFPVELPRERTWWLLEAGRADSQPLEAAPRTTTPSPWRSRADGSWPPAWSSPPVSDVQVPPETRAAIPQPAPTPPPTLAPTLEATLETTPAPAAAPIPDPAPSPIPPAAPPRAPRSRPAHGTTGSTEDIPRPDPGRRDGPTGHTTPTEPPPPSWHAAPAPLPEPAPPRASRFQPHRSRPDPTSHLLEASRTGDTHRLPEAPPATHQPVPTPVPPAAHPAPPPIPQPDRPPALRPQAVHDHARPALEVRHQDPRLRNDDAGHAGRTSVPRPPAPRPVPPDAGAASMPRRRARRPTAEPAVQPPRSATSEWPAAARRRDPEPPAPLPRAHPPSTPQSASVVVQVASGPRVSAAYWARLHVGRIGLRGPR
jgi:hypothetical protein